MSRDRVIFGFVVVLNCTLTFGFFIGDMSRPDYHHPLGLLAAVVVSLMATAMKFGDRTQLGALHLATGLVTSVHLLAAGVLWIWRVQVTGGSVDPLLIADIVSLSGGALLASMFSIVLLLGEVLQHGR